MNLLSTPDSYVVIDANEVKGEGEDNVTQCCMWCRSDIVNNWVGIPTKIERIKEEDKEVLQFYCHGHYCTFECCYSGIKRQFPASCLYKDSLYMNSEQMLKMLYNICYPDDAKLLEAPDWRLLKINGGCLDYISYNNHNHYYVRTINVSLISTKNHNSPSSPSSLQPQLQPQLNPTTKILSDINPTFILRAIDVLKTIDKYINGLYSTLNYKSLTKPSISLNTGGGGLVISTDKVNVKGVITTGSDSFTFAEKDHNNMLPIAGTCMWCRTKITKIPIGIPIKMEHLHDKKEPIKKEHLKTEQLRIENFKGGNVNVKIDYSNEQIIFHVDGTYCTFECCYAGLLRQFSSCYLYRDPLYINSEPMLKLMYKLCFNDTNLSEAVDWISFKNNGGHTDLESYHQNSHYYVTSKNMLILPSKISYQTINVPT